MHPRVKTSGPDGRVSLSIDRVSIDLEIARPAAVCERRLSARSWICRDGCVLPPPVALLAGPKGRATGQAKVTCRFMQLTQSRDRRSGDLYLDWYNEGGSMNGLQRIFAVRPIGQDVAALTDDDAAKNVFLTKESLTFPGVSLAGAAILRFLDSSPDKLWAVLIAVLLGGFVMAIGLATGTRTKPVEWIQDVGVGLINILLLAVAIYGGAIAVAGT